MLSRRELPSGARLRWRCSKTHISSIPSSPRKSHRAVVFEADLLGQVGVGGEREGGAGLDAHLGELARGIELADRLAQARGGDLDRDPALGDRFHRRLVEGAQVALGQRPRAAPDLDQVGVGEDVEEAGAGAVGERLEVAAPDLVGVAAALPDVEAVVVDGRVALADEVDRADDVVEVARAPAARRSAPRRRGRSRTRSRAAAACRGRTRSRRRRRRRRSRPRAGGSRGRAPGGSGRRARRRPAPRSPPPRRRPGSARRSRR